MAIAQCMSAAHFNRDGFALFDYRIWGPHERRRDDGGVPHEACALAGHLKLRNSRSSTTTTQVSIDGPTSLSFSEDVAMRFEGYGWHVLRVPDVNDLRLWKRRSRPPRPRASGRRW